MVIKGLKINTVKIRDRDKLLILTVLESVSKRLLPCVNSRDDVTIGYCDTFAIPQTREALYFWINSGVPKLSR